MLDYTLSAIDKIVKDLKRISYCFTLLMQLLYISYLIYAIAAPSGILAVNIVLCLLSVAYLIFYLITQGSEKKRVKHAYYQTKRAFKWFKLAIKAFTLGIALYGIYATVNEANITPLSVILTALMVVAWTLQVILEAVLFFIIKEKDLLLTAINADIEAFKRPINIVNGFVDKLKGESAEAPALQSKNRIMLDNMVAQKREKKREEKRLRREIRRNKFIASIKSKLPQKKSKSRTDAGGSSKSES